MRSVFLLFCCTVLLQASCSQLRVTNFHTLRMSFPNEQKTWGIETIYKDDKIEFSEEKVFKRYKVKTHKQLDKMGDAIDYAGVINYKSDTVYILSAFYLPTNSVSLTIKANSGAYMLYKNTDNNYKLIDLESSYIGEPENVKHSDYLLYDAIFSWDMNLLQQLIISSGASQDNHYTMSATRVIVNDYQAIKKDIISFNPAVRWKL